MLTGVHALAPAALLEASERATPRFDDSVDDVGLGMPLRYATRELSVDVDEHAAAAELQRALPLRPLVVEDGLGGVRYLAWRRHAAADGSTTCNPPSPLHPHFSSPQTM